MARSPVAPVLSSREEYAQGLLDARYVSHVVPQRYGTPVERVTALSQAQYDALASYDGNTLYLIVE